MDNDPNSAQEQRSQETVVSRVALLWVSYYLVAPGWPGSRLSSHSVPYIKRSHSTDLS